jgi:hypothetical protein
MKRTQTEIALTMLISVSCKLIHFDQRTLRREYLMLPLKSMLHPHKELRVFKGPAIKLNLTQITRSFVLRAWKFFPFISCVFSIVQRITDKGYEDEPISSPVIFFYFLSFSFLPFLCVCYLGGGTNDLSHQCSFYC